MQQLIRYKAIDPKKYITHYLYIILIHGYVAILIILVFILTMVFSHFHPLFKITQKVQ